MNVLCTKDVRVTFSRTSYIAFSEGKVYKIHEVTSSKRSRILADDNRNTIYTIDDADMPGFFDEHFELAE